MITQHLNSTHTPFRFLTITIGYICIGKNDDAGRSGLTMHDNHRQQLTVWKTFHFSQNRKSVVCVAQAGNFKVIYCLEL